MEKTYTGKAQGGKLLRLTVDCSEESIRNKAPIISAIGIHGDFFAYPEEAFDTLEASLIGRPLGELSVWFSKGINDYSITIFGLLPLDIEIAQKKLEEDFYETAHNGA